MFYSVVCSDNKFSSGVTDKVFVFNTKRIAFSQNMAVTIFPLKDHFLLKDKTDLYLLKPI